MTHLLFLFLDGDIDLAVPSLHLTQLIADPFARLSHFTSTGESYSEEADGGHHRTPKRREIDTL